MPSDNIPHRIAAALISLAAVVCVGAVDASVGVEMGFSAFYALPVLYATWYSLPVWGLILASIAAWLWTGANIWGGMTYSYAWVPYWNFIVRTIFMGITAVTLTQVKEALRREQALSRHDGLTGAVNWQYFNELGRRELERCRRYQRSISVAYIDCDNFKSVNDSRGHSAGNLVLCAVVRTIQSALRSSDTVARAGGDEFVILLPESGHVQSVEVMRRVQQALTERMRRDNVPVTFSIGMASAEKGDAELDHMVKHADRLMYQAKHSGKNSLRHMLVGADGVHSGKE